MIDEMLAAARARFRRLEPAEAAAAVRDGGLIVDTRSYEQRRDHGLVPGAVVLSRNVLEWRVDPTSGFQDPRVAARTGPVVVMCQEGYSSSLAAATLLDLGISDATDLAGGFEAWRDAGLPVVPADEL